jgi:hypothetical protein
MTTIKEILKGAAKAAAPLLSQAEVIPVKEYQHTHELITELLKTNEIQISLNLELLIILATRDGLNADYTDVLCKLLMEEWHEYHEDIVMMLEEIKDQNSVNALYSTALKIPEYDDGRSLAKKCIWALGAINNENANAKLQELAGSHDEIIAEAAKIQLAHFPK